MPSPTEAAVSVVTLPDADYFVADAERHSRLQRQLIVMNGFVGTAIGAPRTVDLAARSTLPVLWAARETNLRAWQVIGSRNSTVVVADLATGRVRTQNAYHGPKKEDVRQLPRSAAGSRADIVAPEGATVGLEMLDLRSVANLPWQPGRLAVTLLMHDWRSNTVEVELARAGAAPAAPVHGMPAAEALAVEEGHRRQASATFPPVSVGPVVGAPGLRGPGITAVPSGQRSGMTQRWFLDVSARVLLTARGIVEAAGAGGPKLPAAVVPVTILVASLDVPVPRQIDIQVPVHASAPLKAGDEASVAFRVDIGSALRSPLAPGTYQVYVVALQHLAGPYPFTVAP